MPERPEVATAPRAPPPCFRPINWPTISRNNSAHLIVVYCAARARVCPSRRQTPRLLRLGPFISLCVSQVGPILTGHFYGCVLCFRELSLMIRRRLLGNETTATPSGCRSRGRDFSPTRPNRTTICRDGQTGRPLREKSGSFAAAAIYIKCIFALPHKLSVGPGAKWATSDRPRLVGKLRSRKGRPPSFYSARNKK